MDLEFLWLDEIPFIAQLDYVGNFKLAKAPHASIYINYTEAKFIHYFIYKSDFLPQMLHHSHCILPSIF